MRAPRWLQGILPDPAPEPGSPSAPHADPPTPATLASVEEVVAAADHALGEEQWALAAERLRHARTLAPTSGRLCQDLAFALQQMGRHEDALRLYGEAHALRPESGEPAFHAALAALAAGHPLDEAEAWMRRALLADPHLGEDAMALAALRGRPGFEAALQQARQATRRGGRSGRAAS